MRQSNFLNYSVIISAVLSVVFFVVLFYSIRFEPDDMITSGTLTENSLWDVLINKYHSTSFRPLFIVTSVFTVGYKTTDVNQYYVTVFIYFLSVYSLFVFSIYKLLREIFSLDERKLLLFSFANLLFTCVYFFTTEKIEIFGWYCCSTIYLLPVSILCFASWILIKKQRSKTDFVLLFICAVLIAGGAEHVPVSVIAVAGLIAALLFFEKRKNKTFFIENKWLIFKTVFFISTMTLFFILFVTNPGLWSHYSDTQSDALKAQNIVSFSEIKLFFKPAKLIGLILLVFIWTLFPGSAKTEVKSKINLKYFLAGFVAILFVAIGTSVLAYHSLGVGRIWFVADISFFVLISALIIKYDPFQKNNFKLVLAGFVLIIFLLFDIRHVPALLEFSSEYDKIILDLRQQDSGKVVVLKNFPSPDLTNQVELSPDPDNAENHLFCRFYNIKAKVSFERK